MPAAAPIPGRTTGRRASRLGTWLVAVGAASVVAGWLGRSGSDSSPLLEAIGSNSARLPEWVEVLGTILVVLLDIASGPMIYAGAALVFVGCTTLAWRALAAGRP